MKKIPLFFLSLILVGCISTGVVDRLKPCQQAYDDENYIEAIVRLSLFIKQNPQAPEIERAYFLLGKSYYAMKNYYQSALTFQEYLKKWPDSENSKEAYNYLTRINEIFMKQKMDREKMRQKYEQLILAYEKALSEKPNKDVIYIELGNLYLETGDVEKAHQAYKDALAFNPRLRKDRDFMKKMREILEIRKSVSRPVIVVKNEYIYEQRQKVYREVQTAGEIETQQYYSGPVTLVISGIVENKGRKPATYLRILVSAEDFFGHILDCRYAYIGYLGAGESRPFSVRMENLTKEKVRRVKYQPVFE